MSDAGQSGPGGSQRSVVTGWGRTHPASVHTARPATRRDLSSVVVDADDEIGIIARGLGRSYGDAAQLENGLVVTLDRFKTARWADEETGLLRVGSGITIGALIDRFVPHGWFVPVTPGTRQVTVGGAIAADIHGKNHHQDGSWCNFVETITIMVASGQLVLASRERNPGLFWATCGGMGLTGVVVEATVRMSPIESSRLMVETRRTADLDELMAVMTESDEQHRFSVAWVDLMHPSGRGVLTQGGFAPSGPRTRPGSASATIPRVPLPRLVQPPFVRAFNELWFRRAPTAPTITDESITAFFHPLDAISNWNRLYGPHGFVQWQIALPPGSEEVMRDVAGRLSAANAPAFFAVLKRFGAGNDAPLSFPTAGWTLALDLPAGDESTLALLDTLDAHVVDNGGRVYLAKDSRMRPEHLAQMYPRLDEWRATRDRWDPNRRFDSDLARRLRL